MSNVKSPMSNAYVDPWDMMNKFGFHVCAQKCQVVKGPYKIGRQFARTLFERVEWVAGAAESKKVSDGNNV